MHNNHSSNNIRRLCENCCFYSLKRKARIFFHKNLLLLKSNIVVVLLHLFNTHRPSSDIKARPEIVAKDTYYTIVSEEAL